MLQRAIAVGALRPGQGETMIHMLFAEGVSPNVKKEVLDRQYDEAFQKCVVPENIKSLLTLI